ncbi:MAG: hypothetical protein M0R73_02870 [Dehalococcoidia bacterium]|nr:hypothetical protein [Dehalococcoidia bacterium]
MVASVALFVGHWDAAVAVFPEVEWLWDDDIAFEPVDINTTWTTTIQYSSNDYLNNSNFVSYYCGFPSLCGNVDFIQGNYGAGVAPGHAEPYSGAIRCLTGGCDTNNNRADNGYIRLNTGNSMHPLSVWAPYVIPHEIGHFVGHKIDYSACTTPTVMRNAAGGCGTYYTSITWWDIQFINNRYP